MLAFGLQARDNFSPHAYQSVNETLVIFGLITGTFSLAMHTYTSVFITRQFGIHNSKAAMSYQKRLTHAKA
jgi:hypothetical protein